MKNSIVLGIETLENKSVVLEKLGVFFLIATHIEKALAEYILSKTKNNQFRDKTLGVKETEFNRIVAPYNQKRYMDATLLLKDFRERRNDITHKTLIIEPHYFEEVFSVNWHDEETMNKDLSDEISVKGYIDFLDKSTVIGRDLLVQLLALLLYEDIEEKNFEESKALLSQKPFCFNNRHC